jgi:dolichol-phosphate mannosyltransferase
MSNLVWLSILMPALNEEKKIKEAVANTLKTFCDFSIAGEVIVINDGSIDTTKMIVQEIQETTEKVRMINHDTPQGIGASFWDGVALANGDFICMLPGDNENNPWEIMRYCKLLEHVDIVIPFVFNKQKRSIFRNVLSFVYRNIISLTFLVNLNYTNGTVLYRKSLLDELSYRSDGFFFQTDILIRTIKKGYLFAEVPYRLGMRVDGVSKAVTFPSLLQVIRGYLRLVKDILFKKEGKFNVNFTKDSLTSKRREEAKDFEK